MFFEGEWVARPPATLNPSPHCGTRVLPTKSRLRASAVGNLGWCCRSGGFEAFDSVHFKHVVHADFDTRQLVALFTCDEHDGDAGRAG